MAGDERAEAACGRVAAGQANGAAAGVASGRAAVEAEARVAPAPRMPIIGIVPSQNAAEKMVCFPERYAKAIINSGGAPLLLPLSGDPGVYETLFPLIDGFVLTGGNDIDPARYGAIRDSGTISAHSPEREELEYLILSHAYRLDLPLLGICRGMQMINVCFGGTLYRDLTDQFPGVRRAGYGSGEGELPTLAHWQDPPYDAPSHKVDIVPGTRLAALLQARRIKVNSMHHQGICDLSSLVDAAAYGEDGLVEAIEVRDRTFMMGVQWHPEFFEGKHRMAQVFDALIDAACRAHGRTHEAQGLGEARARAARAEVITYADCI